MKGNEGTARNDIDRGDDVYRLLVENADQSIYIVQDGLIRFANPKSSQMSGYGRDELYGMPVADLVHPDDREWVMRRHVLRSRGDVLENRYTHRIVNKRGQIRWIEVSAAHIRLQDGPAVMVFATDISDRKQAEDALRESEYRYRSLFHSAPSGIFYYDPNLRLVEANERFMSAFAPPGVSLVGMDLGRVYDKRISSCLAKPLAGEEGKYVGGFRESRDSDELWLFINTLPVYRADGSLAGGIGIFQDLTEWKKTELILRERESELHIKSRHLEEANTALQVILRHNEEELEKLRSSILANIDEMVTPVIRKIRGFEPSGRISGYLDLVEINLRDIVSPFMKNLSIGHFNLTPQEKRIATLIRKGMKTDDIAGRLGLSKRSVEHHRYKIRSKLGLCNSGTNLRTFLMSLAGDE